MDHRRKKFLKLAFRNDCENFEPDDFLHRFGNTKNAILYSTLFLPALEEYCGSVLLASSIEENAAKVRFKELRKAASSASELEFLESSFNFVEVGYQFADRSSLEEEDDFLAELVAESWIGYLATRYPNRVFEVALLSPDKTGSVTGIHFFEKRANQDSSL